MIEHKAIHLCRCSFFTSKLRELR